MSRTNVKCLLCGSDSLDEDIFGILVQNVQKQAHRNCLIICMGKMVNSRQTDYALCTFLRKIISVPARRFNLTKCTYCSLKGANITCNRKNCHRNFHLNCGVNNLALIQYGNGFQSYCNLHLPVYPYMPEPDETCIICYSSVFPDSGRFSMAYAFKLPCCLNGWTHRSCAQRHANASKYFYSCPLCMNRLKFSEVAMLGVSIPIWRKIVPTFVKRVANLQVSSLVLYGVPVSDYSLPPEPEPLDPPGSRVAHRTRSRMLNNNNNRIGNNGNGNNDKGNNDKGNNDNGNNGNGNNDNGNNDKGNNDNGN